MRIFIDKNLTPKASQSGWPEAPSENWSGASTAHQDDIKEEWEHYHDALDKAKEESVAFDDTVEINHYLSIHDRESVYTGTVTLQPNSFLEVEIDVEFKKQHQLFGSGLWVDSMFDSEPMATRTIARIKPAKKEESPDYQCIIVTPTGTIKNGETVLPTIDEIENLFSEIKIDIHNHYDVDRDEALKGILKLKNFAISQLNELDKLKK